MPPRPAGQTHASRNHWLAARLRKLGQRHAIRQRCLDRPQRLAQHAKRVAQQVPLPRHALRQALRIDIGPPELEGQLQRTLGTPDLAALGQQRRPALSQPVERATLGQVREFVALQRHADRQVARARVRAIRTCLDDGLDSGAAQIAHPVQAHPQHRLSLLPL